jgi:hypothetical protein
MGTSKMNIRKLTVFLKREEIIEGVKYVRMKFENQKLPVKSGHLVTM